MPQTNDTITRKLNYKSDSELTVYEPPGDNYEPNPYRQDVRTESTATVTYKDQHGNAVKQATKEVSYSHPERDFGTYGEDRSVSYDLVCANGSQRPISRELFDQVNAKFDIVRRNNAMNWVDYSLGLEPTVNLPSPNAIEQACAISPAGRK